MPTVDHRNLADTLWRAERSRRSTGALTTRFPDFTLDDGYAVQRVLVDLHLDSGEALVGAKLGFTSRAMQRNFGVSEPNYGWLTDRMLLQGSGVDLDELIHPRVEPEIAFRLSGALRGPGVTAEQVLESTDALFACIEVVDSRYTAYSFALPDNTADNSSAARLRLGAPVRPDAIDVRVVGVVLEEGEEVLATAAGAAALGDPASAVAWLANRLAEDARGLEPGDILLSGGLTQTFTLRPGARVTAHFDRLGRVDVSGVGSPSEPEEPDASGPPVALAGAKP